MQKSRFCVPDVHYLGCIVGYGSISIDSEIIQAIKDYPVLKSISVVDSPGGP